MKKGLLGIVILATLLACPKLDYAEPVTISFRARAYSNVTGFLDGSYNTTVGIYKGKTGAPLWSEYHANVPFVNGYFDIIIGDKEQGKIGRAHV